MSYKTLPGRVVAVLFLTAGLLFAFALPPLAGAAEKSFPVLDSDALVKMITEDGRGKVVLVSVFASWCPPCRVEMPMLIKTRAETPEQDLLMIGLSVDESTRDLSKFVEDQRINFPVYLGTRELFQAMGIGPIPHTFIFNRQGEVAESIVGLIPEARFEVILSKLLGKNGD